MSATQFPEGIVAPDDRLVMVVGNYGSGKTEVAIHLARGLARSGASVQIADLDLVNPYFRCREAKELMEADGIRVVTPPPSQQWADLPIVVPEIYGMLHPPEGTHVLFDVGGDDVGARVLASLRCALGDAPHQLWQVINARRPFTNTADGCLAMRASIEKASRMTVTGLVVNTHLMDDTTPAIVLEGWSLAREVARRGDLPIRCVAVPERLRDASELACIDAPLLPLRRTMLPPWWRRDAHAVPLGRRKGDDLGSHLD